MLDDRLRLLHEIRGASLARAATARRAAMALKTMVLPAISPGYGPASTRYLAEEELEAMRHLLQLICETRNEAVALTLAEAASMLNDGLPVPLDPTPAFRGFLEADQLDAARHLLRLLAAAPDEAVGLTIAQAIAVLVEGLPLPLRPHGPFRRLVEEEELDAVRHLLRFLGDGNPRSSQAALEALMMVVTCLPVALNPSAAERAQLCTEIERAMQTIGEHADQPNRIQQLCPPTTREQVRRAGC